MSHENVETIRRALDAAPEDVQPLFALLDEEVEWDVRAFPDGAIYYRPEGVREFLQNWAGAFDDFGFEAEDAIDAGDKVVVPMRQWGRGKETGAEVEGRTWQVFAFRDGKIIRCRGYSTEDEAFEAAGLSTDDTHSAS